MQPKKESVISKLVSFQENLFGKSLFEKEKSDFNVPEIKRNGNSNEDEKKGEELAFVEKEVEIVRDASHESINSATIMLNEEEWEDSEEDAEKI